MNVRGLLTVIGIATVTMVFVVLFARRQPADQGSHPVISIETAGFEALVARLGPLNRLDLAAVQVLRAAVVDSAARHGWAAGCVWEVSAALDGRDRVVSLLDLPPDNYYARIVGNPTPGLLMVVLDLPGHPPGGSLVERQGTGFVCFYPNRPGTE